MRISEKKLQDAEKLVLTYRDQMRQIKEIEAERIKKEFRQNKYEERFNVNLEKVIKALFGDKDKYKFLNPSQYI